MELANFCKNISYQFKNESLLLEALTHPSYTKYNKSETNYQRLEFLGDKVLSLVISQFLMKKYPQENEGDLSKRHASLVSGDTLSKIALDVQIEKVLRVSLGEENLGGKNNKRNLENALEALIGAIYLDSGFDESQKFIFKFWHDYFNQNLSPPKDPVSQLQEFAQLNSKQLPQYEITKTSGSDHSPIFTAKVMITHLNLSFEAQGKSKKEAQKEVALLALKEILTKNG